MKQLLLVLLLLAPLASAEVTDFRFTSFDGTELDARIVTPEGDGPWPAVLVPHGWGGSFDSSTATHHQEILSENGYLVMSWTARGFGGSEGVSTLNGPDEVADMRALIDYLAQDDRVLMENETDPILGAYGRSYAGAIMQLAAREDGRLDALVPITTWSNLAHSLAPQDVPKMGWLSLLYASGIQSTHGVGDDPNALNGDGMMNEIHEWYAHSLATGDIHPEAYTALGGVRSLHEGERSTPSLFIQGWPDTLFPASDAIVAYDALRANNGTARLMLTPMGHGGFYANDLGDWDLPWQLELEAEAIDFLNLHLKDNGTRPQYPVLRYEYASQAYLPELQWPPAGTNLTKLYMSEETLSETAPTSNETTTLLLGQAQTCTDVPNFQAEASFCPYDAPGDSATWVMAPFTAATEVTGQPEIHIEFTTTSQTGARLFATLMDIDPSGTAHPILRQTAPHAEGFIGDIQIKMEPITHTFEAGHSLGVQIATSNAFMASTREPGTVGLVSYVAKPAMLLVPFVEADKFGDRQAPEIVVEPYECDNCTGIMGTVLNITVEDDWQADAKLTLGNETVNATWSQTERGMRTTVAIEWTTTPQILHITAVDPTGKNSTESVEIPAFTAEPLQEATPETSTPGFGLAAAIIALALVARRR